MPTETMRAARFHGLGDLRVEQVAVPAPGPGELLLRVLACGVCGSDAGELRRPAMIRSLDEPHPASGHVGPVTMGHEFAGEVVALGEGVDGVREGALVACGAGVSAGGGPARRAARTNLAPSYYTLGFHADGGLAEYVVAPAAICFDVAPYGLTADAAALAQPMAIAVHAARGARASAGEQAVVLGAGGIGVNIATALAAWGVEVVVADLAAERLTIAAAVGAHHTVLADELPDLLARERISPDVIFEVSGSRAGLDSAFAIAPRGARIVPAGFQKQPYELDVARLTLAEQQLIGTVAHVAADDMPEALRLLAGRADGWADVAPLAIPLEALVEEALQPLLEGRATRVKTLIDPHVASARPART
ncbi:alcohol dehydrogenase catalytic domain-containing protein [Conexibacter stalactiti]|uniref:Alcohol dehydrogenase catalytic domain-containing protein n=1 Tax=Conexibacter stalactiti TaxID=1940611 RepID=A0ABU4HMG9_9ACTN|nr:alcohol dehydrogenase catalytic domain-containing protein [Conexibacter stalactiti]MDW5594505.1 alcohol dehydrogenase catalytic domain-containing protein [Conexibacter stalactiti]MEC5035147.1 alcohol dehydrogenase catalytic domain-containing protein [Conexibacter stalactiti]